MDRGYWGPSMRRFLPAVATLVAAVLGTPAMAAEIWLDADHTAYSNGQTASGSFTFSGGGVNLRVSAWSINSSGVISSAQLGIWDPGLGIVSGRTDNTHMIDNSGSRDFLLFQFDKAVELEKAWFNTGWDGISDTDATIGYALSTLGFASPPPLNGKNESYLTGTSPGQLGLETYGSLGALGNNNRPINPGDDVGNLWLIGASFAKSQAKLDGFKLEKISFNVAPPPPPAVPEPATWLMMILGFGFVGGAMRARRRERLTVSYS